MQFTKLLLLTCATFAAVSSIALADDGVLAPRQVPAKTLPVPSNVSPELQKLIAAPYNPSWNVLWKTGEEWRAAANAQAAHGGCYELYPGESARPRPLSWRALGTTR